MHVAQTTSPPGATTVTAAPSYLMFGPCVAFRDRRPANKEQAMNVYGRTLMAGVMGVAIVLAMAGTARAQGKDIVDTAVAAGQFKTLAAALTAAGLIETLKGSGPFTVFAPTDEAFAKLPKGTVEELLKPENKAKLTAVLTYHVVSGKVMAADVVKMTSGKTVQGGSIAIASRGGKVLIDNATVVKADIGASNGVIHVVDSVLMPK
jgi:uncharacterized surface protein with fasciclin (FAS1) repeats